MIASSAVASPSKAALRRQALGRRGDVVAQTAEAAAAEIAMRGLALAQRLGAAHVAAYWPVRGEAPALELLAALHDAGFATALPAIEGRGAPMRFRGWKPGDAPRPDAHGIPAPLETMPIVLPDLVFVPLVAFDLRGHRIGSGAGYYDRALEVLRHARATTAVGLAFSVQEVAHIPHEPHDQRLDYVITERALIDCTGA